jgi:hypothetical protein
MDTLNTIILNRREKETIEEEKKIEYPTQHNSPTFIETIELRIKRDRICQIML